MQWESTSHTILFKDRQSAVADKPGTHKHHIIIHEHTCIYMYTYIRYVHTSLHHKRTVSYVTQRLKEVLNSEPPNSPILLNGSKSMSSQSYITDHELEVICEC